jgi:hypothetical protein
MGNDSGSDDKKKNNIFTWPLKVLGAIASFIYRYFILAAIIALVFFLVNPLAKVGVANAKSPLDTAAEFSAQKYSQLQKWFACISAGECPTSGDARDLTNYGIFFDSVYTGRTNDKFYKDEKIRVTASANAAYLTSMDLSGCAKVDCKIEDGTVVSKSQGCIPLKNFPTVVICTYAPIISNSGNLKKASVSLTYDFQASTKIPISIVDASAYESLWNSYKEQTGTVSEVESKIAQHYGVVQNPPSDPKLTPLVIGAEIKKNQPIPKGASDVWLSVSVQNEGGGTARINDISIELPQGITLITSEEINLDVFNPIEWTTDMIGKYVLKSDQLSSLKDELPAGDFRAYDVNLGTAGFPLESPTEATTKKINIVVDYTYTTTADKLVTVQTCSEIPGCATSVADSGQSGTETPISAS